MSPRYIDAKDLIDDVEYWRKASDYWCKKYFKLNFEYQKYHKFYFELASLRDRIEQAQFFNQRAGRELWQEKPREVQDRDIESADKFYNALLKLIDDYYKEEAKEENKMFDETAQTTEAFNTGLEAGREEERKKYIEAMRTMSAKITELENIKGENNIRIAEAIKDIWDHKDDPEVEEFRKNCVMIDFVANNMQDEKPYYGIVYYDKRNNTYYEGFHSYDHEVVNAYKEAYFERWDRGYFEKQIEELEDKHWEECRQIALYDDEVKTMRTKIFDQIIERCKGCSSRSFENCKGYECTVHHCLACNGLQHTTKKDLYFGPTISPYAKSNAQTSDLNGL